MYVMDRKKRDKIWFVLFLGSSIGKLSRFLINRWRFTRLEIVYYFDYWINILFVELALKPAGDLLNELSFLSKKKLVTEVNNEISEESNMNFYLFLER